MLHSVNILANKRMLRLDRDKIDTSYKGSHIYWKDLSGFYVGCNQDTVNLAAVSTYRDLIGKKDVDLVWGKHADEYRKNDIIVSETQDILFVPESLTFGVEKKSSMVVSLKLPWCDNFGKIMGIFAVSIMSGKLASLEIIELLGQVRELSKVHEISLSKENYLMKLSRRERQCLKYVLMGKAAKEISGILYLSKRTVESHIENLKIKFNVNKKSDLMEVALKQGLLKIVDF